MSYFNYSSAIFSGFSTNGTSSFMNLANEYSNIKAGSYRRLLKTYYSKFNADGSEKVSSDKNGTKRPVKNAFANVTDSAKDLTGVSDKATALQNAATKLAAVKTGTSSLYAQKPITEKQEDNTTVTKTDYDYKSLVSAAKTLVSAYNDTLDATSKVSASSVTQKTQWVTDLANEYKDELSAIGITFDSDKRMSLDEKKFTATAMEDIQKVFEGTNSFTGKLARKASNLAGAAEVQSTRLASAYNARGSAYKADSMNSGSLFDSLF